jgi:hypothetical protein
MLLSHPAVEDPTDAKGFPMLTPGADHASFLPFAQLHKALSAKRRTVWFLDDLGQAPAAVQAAYMQLLLAREVNGHKLPDCVTFVAATNRRTDRAGVSGILEPVKSRFASIVELEADIHDWSTWALSSGRIAPELVAFLRWRPELLSSFNPSADIVNSPSPRTWEHASWLLSLDLPQTMRPEALAGAVGEGAAAELLAFLSMFAQLPAIDAIMLDPANAIIPGEPSARYAVATALASRVTDETTFSRAAAYAQRLVDAGAGDFGALLVRDCLRKVPELQQTPTFVRIIAGELGTLVHGR